MITRRRILAGLVALPLPMPAAAQRQNVRRIAFLSNAPTRGSDVFQAFSAGLLKLGWIEGKNIEIDFQSSKGKDALYPDIAAKVVREKVDLIVTTGSAPTRAAMAATKEIPIVFGSTANPVEQGFVKSHANPGGNVTGMELLVRELGEKRWEFLKALVPRATRYARLYDPNSIKVMQATIIKEDVEIARKLRVTIRQIPVEKPEDIEPALNEASSTGIECMHVTAASLFVVNSADVAKYALNLKMPILGPDHRYVRDGILASYGENFTERYGEAAVYVDKILRGAAKPADLPVQRAASFELWINLRTAKALGITLSQAVRVQAGRNIIE